MPIMATLSKVTLDTLPTEVLFNIYSLLQPQDVSSLSKVNKTMYGIHFHVLKSIDHLNLHKFTSIKVVQVIIKYNNITSLDISGGRWFQLILRKDDERQEFATKMAANCPKIDDFAVSEILGLDFVKQYIECRHKNATNRHYVALKGIKNLRVDPRNVTKCKQFLQLSNGIKDIVNACDKINCLTIDPIMCKLRGKLSQIKNCWMIIGQRINGLDMSRNDEDGWLTTDRKASTLIVPLMTNLSSLSFFHASNGVLDNVTANNPGLRSLKISFAHELFHVQRLKQLEHFQVTRHAYTPSNDEVDQIVNGIKDTLITIRLGFTSWNKSLMAIGEKCRKLRSLKFRIMGIGDEEWEEINKLKNMFGDDVDCIIKSGL